MIEDEDWAVKSNGGKKSIKEKESNIKQQQQDILLSGGSQDIKKNVLNLLTHFNPPICKNCLKRKADRVCVNKECGPSKYLQIICGKCHADLHSKATQKPEMDIQEYFLSLTSFSNKENFQLQNQHRQQFDIDRLKLALKDIDSARDYLNLLKSKITADVDSYERPSQSIPKIVSYVAKALSKCEYKNFIEQLRQIKKLVQLENNQCCWKNDVNKLFCQYKSGIDNLERTQDSLFNNTKKSFNGDQIFDLSTFCLRGELRTRSPHGFANLHIEGQNNKIVISKDTENRQLFLDYKLDPELVYRLRFTFLVNPKEYNVIGIMPKSIVTSHWISPFEHTLHKNFFYGDTQEECSKIIKGADLKKLPVKGYQIEMRIDIKNKYIDFADYPNYNNINSNHEHQQFIDEPYVIVIALFKRESISIDSFEVINSIIDR